MRVIHIITGIPPYCHPEKREARHCHPEKCAAFIRDLKAKLIKLNRLFIRSRHKAGTTDGAQGRDYELSHSTNTTTVIPECAKRLSGTLEQTILS